MTFPDPMPSAADLYAALVPLKAAPTEDPEHRPNGPEPEDWHTMLGILTSHADRLAAVGIEPDEAPDWTTSYIGHAASNDGMPGLVVQLAARIRMTSRTLDDLAPADGKSDLWDALCAAMTAAASLSLVMAARHTNVVDGASASDIRANMAKAKRSIQDARRHYEAVSKYFRDHGYPI